MEYWAWLLFPSQGMFDQGRKALLLPWLSLYIADAYSSLSGSTAVYQLAGRFELQNTTHISKIKAVASYTITSTAGNEMQYRSRQE